MYDCTDPGGYVASSSDCDDGDGDVHPGAAETCDGVDQDCDGSPDDGVAYQNWYPDSDHDGYGAMAGAVYDCEAPAGYLSSSSDCDDADASVRPGATETCDGSDQDCDGVADDGLSDSWWYPDGDGDAYGNNAGGVYDCAAPAGYVSGNSDCDDGNGGVHPGAAETCDAEDEDCDGVQDEDVASCWTAIYRFKNPSNEARCWNTTTTPPSTCSGYALEIEAWVVRASNLTGTFRMVQCSQSTDHILVEYGGSDYTALVGAGYNCSVNLGYPYRLGYGPAAGTTPFDHTCDMWRFSHTVDGGSGAHFFTRGADDLTGMTCEAPARAEVLTDYECFAGTPAGC